MKDKLTYAVLKQKQSEKFRKPVLGWIAYDLQGNEIDRNNSIALLRYKFGSSVIIKSIR